MSNPKTIRWRQALPPLFILSLVILIISSIWFPIAQWIVSLELLLYILALLALGTHLAFRNRDTGFLLGIPIAMAVMHMCWGSGFLWSILVKRKG